jgi:hypothetical protein
MKTNINERQMLEELGISTASPFKTPKGYFEELTSRVMKNIPYDDETAPEPQPQERRETTRVAYLGHQTVTLAKRKNTSQLFIRWTSAAAASIALIFGAIHYFGSNNENPRSDSLTAFSTAEVYDDEYGEDLLSYSMMDTQDVYSYLSGDYN